MIKYDNFSLVYLIDVQLNRCFDLNNLIIFFLFKLILIERKRNKIPTQHILLVKTSTLGFMYNSKKIDRKMWVVKLKLINLEVFLRFSKHLNRFLDKLLGGIWGRV